jgi:RES domain-containing protein
VIRGWRLVAPQWATSAFDGEGARLAGGRWNSKGVPVVYLASSLALAALELLVHIDYARALQEHVAIPVDFDEALMLHVAFEDLPENWTEAAALPRTRSIGDAWAKRRASAVLAVPSAVVPAELNYLLNPQHPNAGRIRIGKARPFRFDPRLIKPPPEA